MASYAAVRDTLKTGDLLIFSGKGAISSFIKLFSGGKWSHVGMVLRLDGLDDTVLLWESTTLANVPDIETRAATKGVQLVPLSQRIAAYRGEIVLRAIEPAPGPERLSRLAGCRRELSRKPYERSEFELLKAAWDGLGGASEGEDLSSVFCSELVAEAYQAMGLLPQYPEGLPSNEYTPLDFSSQRQLALRDGFRLGPEIPLNG